MSWTVVRAFPTIKSNASLTHGLQSNLGPRALADLREIVSHIACDKPNAARSFGLKLIQTAESAATFPERGQ